jgi:hypothetical protein
MKANFAGTVAASAVSVMSLFLVFGMRWEWSF